jgi:hypothetical protein
MFLEKISAEQGAVPLIILSSFYLMRLLSRSLGFFQFSSHNATVIVVLCIHHE